MSPVRPSHHGIALLKVFGNCLTMHASHRLQSKVQQYVRGADQTMLEQMRLTVFEVVVGVLRSKEFQGDIPKAVETACKVRHTSL